MGRGAIGISGERQALAAVAAGALTFVLVVLAVGVHGLAAGDACLTDPAHPVHETWSGSQRLAGWPPAAVRCEGTTPGGTQHVWTIASWSLWLLYGAVLLAALVAARGWGAPRRE